MSFRVEIKAEVDCRPSRSFQPVTKARVADALPRPPTPPVDPLGLDGTVSHTSYYVPSCHLGTGLRSSDKMHD